MKLVWGEFVEEYVPGRLFHIVLKNAINEDRKDPMEEHENG